MKGYSGGMRGIGGKKMPREGGERCMKRTRKNEVGDERGMC